MTDEQIIMIPQRFVAQLRTPNLEWATRILVRLINHICPAIRERKVNQDLYFAVPKTQSANFCLTLCESLWPRPPGNVAVRVVQVLNLGGEKMLKFGVRREHSKSIKRSRTFLDEKYFRVALSLDSQNLIRWMVQSAEHDMRLSEGPRSNSGVIKLQHDGIEFRLYRTLSFFDASVRRICGIQYTLQYLL
ncbi:hypothetical protein RRG08_002495 [Elysia crispata]|uniref:Uncharacterized protein n=1 Tax=Elysia crispata TaxID=231223 RepID=A0AAE1DUJ7_9GAST|nr:hypothetical protein RRG08_002495 [Elysia crispata]